MAYTGKATYDDADSIHEDVSDIVSINALAETPFLDFLGDPMFAAKNTKHEWLEDALLANTDAVNDATFDSSETTFTVDDGTKFRVGNMILIEDEILEVTIIATNLLTVVRGIGSTVGAAHADNTAITILGTAALEGEDADDAKSTNRTRQSNYTQIIRPATINVSDTEGSVSQIGITDEYEHQKAQRVVEGMRDLENFAINGSQQTSTPGGSDTVRRTMQGWKWWLSSNVNDASSAALTDVLMQQYIQNAWDNGAKDMNFILASGRQRRAISNLKDSVTDYTTDDRGIRHRIDFYETDFGMLQILKPDRWVPADEFLIGTSSNLDVLPLQGMSFYHKPLAVSGDYTKGLIQGEYTMQMRHEETHVWVKNLATAS